MGCIIYVVVTMVLKRTAVRPASPAEVYVQPQSAGNSADSSADLRCIMTVTEPKIDVCLYSASDDKFMSAVMIAQGTWQPTITQLIQRALSNYIGCDVIDLGAHIGFYTILAAKMRHRVLAVEPVTSSLRRIHHAALLSGVRNKITLFHNAVFNKRTLVWLRQPHGNVAGTSVVVSNRSQVQHSAGDSEAVKTILMDDLYPYIQQRIVIIKMDVGGGECRAISSATQLFSGVHIPYIFMAWHNMHSQQKTPKSTCSTSNVERMTIFLAHRGYVPYECVSSGGQLNWRHSVHWNTSHVYWRHVSAADLRDVAATSQPSLHNEHSDDYDQDDDEYQYSIW